MQPYQEIENHYNNPDPWGYKSSPDDLKRKNKIVNIAKQFAPTPDCEYKMALDIAAGEGWITGALPAGFKIGYELSIQARARMPNSVVPVSSVNGKYDLVIATGCMYLHYDYKEFLSIINRCSNNIVITCNIKDWEITLLKDEKYMMDNLHLKQIYSEEFPYLQYTQQLRVFKKQEG
jgi:hypothetical protein